MDFVTRLDVAELAIQLDDNNRRKILSLYELMIQSKGKLGDKRTKGIILNRQLAIGVILKSMSNMLELTNDFNTIANKINSLEGKNFAKARSLYKYLVSMSNDIDVKERITLKDIESINVDKFIEKKKEEEEKKEDDKDGETEDDKDEGTEADVDNTLGDNKTEFEKLVLEIIKTRKAYSELVLKNAIIDFKADQLHILLDRVSDENKELISDKFNIAYRKENKTKDISDEEVSYLEGLVISSIKLADQLMFGLDTDIRRSFYDKYNKLCIAIHSRNKDDKKVLEDNTSVYSYICVKQAVMALLSPISKEKFKGRYDSLYERIESFDCNYVQLAKDFSNVISKYNGYGVEDTITFNGIISALSNFHEEEKLTVEEQKIKSNDAINDILKAYNKINSKTRKLITNIEMPTDLADKCINLSNINFNDALVLGKDSEKAFKNAIASSLLNELIDNDNLSLRFMMEDIVENLDKKYDLGLDRDIIMKLSGHGQLDTLIKQIFNIKEENGNDNTGIKVLIAIVCSSSNYILKNIDLVRKGI